MNLDVLLKYLSLNRNEFLFQFQAHPNYPSALALSDTLNFMGIENSAYELEKEYWTEIPNDFITIYNQKFVLVKKDTNVDNYSVFSDKNSLINEAELMKNSSDLVILLNNDTKKIEQVQNDIYIPFIILFAGSFIITTFNLSLSTVFYNFLSLSGLFISYEIFKQKYGAQSPVLNTICGKVDSESNCNQIIYGNKANLFGLNLSDVSLVYFTGLFFTGTLLGEITAVLFLISALAASIILYSIHVQIFVEKKLCKVCMTIIFILLLQLLIAYLSIYTVNLNFKDIAISTFLFSTTFFMISFSNKLVSKNNELRKTNIKNLKFKRNYELFKKQLLDSHRTSFESNCSGFFLGRKNTKIHISLISNPFCGYCKEAHDIVKSILKKYPDNVSVQIRFNYTNESNDDNLKIVVSHLKYIYKNFGESAFLQKADIWFTKRDLESVKKENTSPYISLFEEIQTGQENLNLGFTFTPLFLINGYKFPQTYDREDIFYFIDELIEDEDLYIK